MAAFAIFCAILTEDARERRGNGKFMLIKTDASCFTCLILVKYRYPPMLADLQ